MPLSALPSPTGVGELGSAARHWLDMLEQAGVTIWQILPLNPVGYGNSPYQPYSSFAGDEIYISLESLYEEGLLKEQPESFREKEARVDYEAVRAFKEPWLRKAWENFQKTEDFETFAPGMGDPLQCVPGPEKEKRGRLLERVERRREKLVRKPDASCGRRGGRGPVPGLFTIPFLHAVDEN